MKLLRLKKQNLLYASFPVSIYIDGEKKGTISGEESLSLKIPVEAKEMVLRESKLRQSKVISLNPRRNEECFLIKQNGVFTYFGLIVVFMFIPFSVRLLTESNLLKQIMLILIILELFFGILIFSLGRKHWIVVKKKEFLE